MTRLHRQIAEWAVGDDTGASSTAIARAALGLPRDRASDTPIDVGDLGRCLRLLHAAPGARAGLRALAEVDPVWACLHKRWRKLSALAREEGVYDWLPGTWAQDRVPAKKTYHMLRSLTRHCDDHQQEREP